VGIGFVYIIFIAFTNGHLLLFIIIFSFSFIFLYHIFSVKVQEMASSASYDKNKTQNRKQTNKEKHPSLIIFIRLSNLRTQIQTTSSKETLLTTSRHFKQS